MGALAQETGGGFQHITLPGNIPDLEEKERKNQLEADLASELLAGNLQTYFDLIDQNTELYGTHWRESMENLQIEEPAKIRVRIKDRKNKVSKLRSERNRVAKQLDGRDASYFVGDALETFIADVRDQYVLSILSPQRREGIVRRLEIHVDHPSVSSVEAPKSTFY